MEEGAGSARPDPGGPEETGSEEQGSRGEPSHRRMTHNMVERRRKDKIKQWISHIAQLLPPVTSAGPDNRPSTLDIMERAAKFISELKASYEQVVTEKGDPVLVAEMNKMRNEIEKLNRERDHLADVIKAQGISLQVDTSQWKGSRRNDSNGPSTSAADNDSHLSGDNSSDGSSKKKSSRRQNTVSAHLEQQKLQEQQQQQALSQLISQNGAAVMPGQSLLLNPLASPSGAMSSAQLTSAAATSSVLNTPTSIGGVQQEATSPVKHPMNNACGLGLLQIAMQDAGITQMDTSQQASPAPASDLQGDPGSADSRMHLSQMDESHENLQALRENLQTLASAASSKGSSSNLMFTSMPSSGMVNMMQMGNASSASLAANNVTVTSSAMTQNTPIMSVGQLSSHPQSASQSNMIMGMNFVNSLNQNAGLGMVNPGQGQVLLPGAPQSGPAGVIPGTSGLSPGTILLNQQGNVLIINENGIPVPYDSTTGTAVQSEKMTAVMGSGALSVSSNSALLSAPAMSVLDQQQQALINSGALTLGKTDHAVSSALASLNVSQPQASILAGMNSQMAGGMNFLGSQLLTQNALQSLAVQQGNPAGGFLNQQLLQSMGMPFPGMIAGSAAGGVTNTTSSQASQAIPGSAATGLATAGGNILFPTNQAGGMVTLNTIPSNPQHLPSAFVLPSGHVIPVVSNPQLVPPGQPGGVMAAPGGSAAAGQLQLPHMAAGPGGAGQVIQMDSGSNPGNPQIIIGPNGLQVAAPPAGQGALTQQQQLQQILQQQQQQGISLMMPTPTINVSQTSTMTTPSVVTLATNAVPMSSMKTVTARSSLATSKVVTMTTQPPTPRSASHGRSQTPSSANRKSQSAKVAAPDVHNSIPNSTAGMVIQTSKGALASLAQNTAGIASTCNSSGAPVGGGGGGGGVVLMMQHNGQTLNVLVDPVTFQVLNPAQSAPAQALSIAPAASLAAISSSDTPANTTAVSSAPKKSKKGGGAQRAIFPKPKSKSSSKASAASKAAAVSLAASTAAVTSASTPLMISTEAPWGDQNAGSGMMSERTAGSGGAELPCADNQDILAKAAESIFTTEEISPPLVYSPTNDDNPLLIDTSAHDGEEERGSASSPKKGITTPKTTPVVAERAKKSQKQDHQKQLLAFQQEQQKQLEESSLLLQQQIQTPDAMQGSLLQQQSPLASSMDQDPSQLLQQQEQEEQKKLQQQQQEQHDHLMRHLESQIALTSSTSQPLPVVPPSMPTLMSPISVPSPAPTTSTSEITPTAPTVSPAPAAVTPAAAATPAPKKSKKSKKKKDKDKEESSDKGADGAVTKSSKKASSKKKKKEEEEARISEAALKRREEIDKKQQQLLLQQQEEQLRRKEEDEDEELRPQQGDQLLLLQQQQLRQAELMPGGIEDGSIVIVRSMRESLNTFPETLEFAPGELCAVLDQVENLGQLAPREEEEVKPAEKASEKPEKPAKKSKKSRDASSDSAEPAAKKSRKSNNSKENSASANANMFLFSPQMNFPLMPQQHAASDELTSSSRMSIYDFQDDSPPTTAAKQETSKSKSKKGSKSKASTSVPPSTILSSTMNITTSAAMASSTNTLDSLMPVTPQSKSSDSLNTPKPAKAKSKKSDKKSNNAAATGSSTSGGNCNVSSASVSSVSDSLVTTMTSSKSNDSISTSDSVSVILPMPGFDTLESLNSPAPLLSPPITSQKSALPENRTPSQTSVQSAETALGQLSSVVSSDVSKNMSVIDSLPDIGDIAAQAGSVETPILQSSQPTLPPVLHHPPQTQNHMDNTTSSNSNSGGSVSQMMQQQKQSTPPQPSQQKQQQQQPPPAQQQQQQQQQQQPPPQQSTSSKPHQQASPRQNQLPQPPQISNHTPPVLATPQQGQTQAHPQMGPPTSPAQAVVGRPRSATSHTLQGAAYPATSPQAGGMHASPSASCISPSSNHSRSSHDGFNQAGGHLAPSPSAAAARMTDMSSLLGGPDMPCPNANLFAASTPKLSHVQKAQSQGKMCSEDSAVSRTRPGIFSADNFVQPSQQPSSIDPRSQQQPPQQQQQQSSSSDSVGGMGRLPGMNDVTGESFNFTSISLNLTSASSQNAGQEMGIASSAGVPFSFSLTSATTTQTSTSASNSSHSQAAPPAFPFYTSQPSSTNQLPPQQGPSLSMLNMPDLRMDNHGHQPPPRQQGIGAAGPPMPSSSQNSFNFGGLMEMGGSCSVGRENPSMGRPVDKSPMAGFSQQHSSAGAGGGSSTGGGSAQKRLVEIPPPQQANHPAAQQQQQQQQPTQPLDHVPPINRSPQMGSHSSKSSSYFPSPNFPSSANLNTPPLRHPPLPSSESGHLMNRAFDHGFGASQTSNSVPLGGQSFDPRGMPYQKDLSQTRPLEHVSSGTSSSSRKPGSQQQQQQQQQQGGGGKQKQGHSPAGSGGNAMGGVTTHSQSRSMAPSQNASHSSATSQRSASAQPPPPAHQTSGSGHPPAPSPSQQQARSAKRKQASSSSSQSKKKPTYSTEIDANLSHNIFDSNQSFPSLFSFQNMSPPPGRNMQSEGPPFLTSNFFGAPSRPLSNSSNKNTPDLGPPYSVFPPSRQQNGIGINFQHGFGMQAMTGNHGGPMTPHSVAVTPHMSNFSLGNIFPDVNGGAGDSGLNISPIKFPHHGQPILPPPQPGMDPNALQHPHQGSALYHNRGHHGQPHMLPNAMTLNSILGHNHHGFDTRPMTQGINSGVGPPFHGPGHPTSFAMPPLNFSMHEH